MMWRSRLVGGECLLISSRRLGGAICVGCPSPLQAFHESARWLREHFWQSRPGGRAYNAGQAAFQDWHLVIAPNSFARGWSRSEVAASCIGTNGF
jgi:hypothetical protein